MAAQATLPGVPPPALRASWDRLGMSRRQALLPHLTGDTSSEYLADWLARAGAPVGATTIKRYRRSLRQMEV